jgi:DNA-binding beta-propeller fold protein YncE
MDGNVTTFAGSHSVSPGLSDGRGTNAVFTYPSRMCFDASGNLMVVDMLCHAVRKITMDGDVTILAGDGTNGYIDGLGTEARFKYPIGIALHPSGDLIVADSANGAIRKISTAGNVVTIAGRTVLSRGMLTM